MIRRLGDTGVRTSHGSCDLSYIDKRACARLIQRGKSELTRERAETRVELLRQLLFA